MSVATSSQSPLELAQAASNRASSPRLPSKRKRPQPSTQWSSDDGSDKERPSSPRRDDRSSRDLPRIILDTNEPSRPYTKTTRISAPSHEPGEEEENIDMLSSSSEGPGGTGAGPSQSRSAPPLPSQGLNRGFACMGCRKRKSRCDTKRPSCEQCIKAKMPCLYDDRPAIRPTDLLKMRIKELEDQLAEMARLHPGLAAMVSSAGSSASGSGSQPGPSGTNPAFLSAGPQSDRDRSGSPHSTGTGPAAAATATELYSITAAAGNLRPGAEGTPYGASGRGGLGLGEAHFFQIAPDISNDPLPPGINQHDLLRIFFSHRHQAYFEISEARFWQTLAIHQDQQKQSSGTSSSTVLHASLLNAMYLLGCFFSGNPQLAAYEPLFLQRARQGIANALELAEGLPPSIQAASLVATYLYSKGRVLEGYYLSCATARFAVGCGLHQIESPYYNTGAAAVGAGGTPLPGLQPLLEPARDATEYGERIHTWWQVWMVDQCASVSTNLPPALYDSSDAYARITTTFPPDIAEFETGSLNSMPGGPGYGAPSAAGVGYGGAGNGSLGTLAGLYDGTVTESQNGSFDGRRKALVVKATELFSRAWKLSKHEVKDDAFRAAFDATDQAIHSLSLTLPRALTEQNVLIPAYILPNMFALAAVIQLHMIFAVEHNHLAPSYQKCLDAATEMIDIINAMEEQRIDFSFLELHIGVGFFFRCAHPFVFVAPFLSSVLRTFIKLWGLMGNNRLAH
ncbi:uncharacterized protein EI90DRAFT_44791 [Cantharellus anzutake]|uniref:uncharacterized protein n=1 Tax=Cantharellus anzutake TaxID=1750568 RepID=UPI00190428D4|nr:uncharacterized protein EI90DRAFT_44791 [Cantharellus anzutake]KAF8344078.1 hypothetical protein EI90DRAFT_44791 [Cantharellus anzutake]